MRGEGRLGAFTADSLLNIRSDFAGAGVFSTGGGVGSLGGILIALSSFGLGGTGSCVTFEAISISFSGESMVTTRT